MRQIQITIITIRIILRYWANGIYSRFKKAYFQATNKCRTDVPLKTKIGPLTLLDLSPAFLVLGIGISISVLSFLLEIIFADITKYKK